MQDPQDQVTGGVWPLASPEVEPELYVQDWEIHEVQLPDRTERTRHVLGLVGWHREGVVSSPIATLEAATHKATTESGRVYILGTRTGGNLDSEYVWNRWRHLNGATDDENVTKPVKELLTVLVTDWQLREHPHLRDPRRKTLHVSGTVQGVSEAYSCDVQVFNPLTMVGVDNNGRFFRLQGPLTDDLAIAFTTDRGTAGTQAARMPIDPERLARARACIADATRPENSVAMQVDAAVMAAIVLENDARHDSKIAEYLVLKHERPLSDAELAPYLAHALSLAKNLLSTKEQR